MKYIRKQTIIGINSKLGATLLQPSEPSEQGRASLYQKDTRKLGENRTFDVDLDSFYRDGKIQKIKKIKK